MNTLTDNTAKQIQFIHRLAKGFQQIIVYRQRTSSRVCTTKDWQGKKKA